MTRGVILCPGPSLARRTELPSADIVLAVNTAMDHDLARGIDWWVALDLWSKPLPRNLPMLGLVTSSAAIAEGQAQRVPHVALRDFREFTRARPVATSLPAALWWFAYLTEGLRGTVELVGCDMTDGADFRGDRDSIRTAQRWDREAAECEEVAGRTGIVIEGAPWRDR